MSKRDIWKLLLTSLLCYIIILICGNFGPLPFKVDTQNCGQHNDCSLSSTLNNEIQFCQSTQGEKDIIHDDFKVQIQFFVPLDYIAQGKTTKVNMTAQFYGSKDASLQKLCQEQIINIQKQTTEMRKDYNLLKYQQWKVQEIQCNIVEAVYNREAVAIVRIIIKLYNYLQCQPLDLIYVENLKPYNLFKVEFAKVLNQDKQPEDTQFLNYIVNSEIEYIGKNPYHRYFIGFSSLIFLIINFIVLIRYFNSFNMIMDGERGHIQMWISGLLIGLIAYNFPYKLFIGNTLLIYILDASLNATFISSILLANLVVIHSLIGKINEQNMCMFYAPKIFLTFLIWIGFYGFVFTEGLLILHQHLILNDFNPQSIGLKIIESFYFIAMCLYIVYTVYYAVKAVRKALMFKQSKFAIFTSFQAILISFLILSMLAMPFQNKTMRFMNENGFINIYLILMSTLMRPQDETYAQALQEVPSYDSSARPQADAEIEMSSMQSLQKRNISEQETYNSALDDSSRIQSLSFNTQDQENDDDSQDKSNSNNQESQGYDHYQPSNPDRQFFQDKNKVPLKDH
eukprot:403344977